jgi:hypothetical protein
MQLEELVHQKLEQARARTAPHENNRRVEAQKAIQDDMLVHPFPVTKIAHHSIATSSRATQTADSSPSFLDIPRSDLSRLGRWWTDVHEDKAPTVPQLQER